MNLCRCEKGHFYDKEKHATCPYCTGGTAMDNGLTVAFTDDVTEPLTQPNQFAGNAQPVQPIQSPASDDKTEKYDSMELAVSDRLADEPTEQWYAVPEVNSPDAPTLDIQKTVAAGDLFDDGHTIGFYDDFFTPATPDLAHVERPVRQAPKPTVNKVSSPCVGWLVALSGEHIGTDFRLKAGKNFVGRGEQMDISLTADKSVSRDRHAIVVYEPKAHLYLVQPGESSSLVYKNDEVVLTPVKLEAYDVITVGNVNLLFMPLCGTRFNWGDLLKKMQAND